MSAPSRTLLYYPSIEIPSGGWLRQAILYWDQLGSVVPQEYDKEVDFEKRYNSDIRLLYDEGVFRPFNPDALFWTNGGPEIAGAFEREFKNALEQRTRRVWRVNTSQQFEQIYHQKVTSSLYEWLLERALAKPMNESANRCFFMERNSYRLYMCLLAKHLAQIDEGFTVTGTDDAAFLRLNYAFK